jgi:hypothetical protein
MPRPTHGHKVWFFPDGDLPQPGHGPLKGHESLVLLNPNDGEAHVTITVYYTDREPDQAPVQTVGARRVRCFRLDEGIGGMAIPFGQYALKVESTVPLVCQIGRMDVSQPNLAYYTVMGYPA